MARFRLLLLTEFKLFRATVPVHLIAILQPTLLFLLMGLVLVYPTFDMAVARPTTPEAAAHVEALVIAMRQVGSPIGLPYINPILVEAPVQGATRQIITVEDRDGAPTAVQRYGLIDSNLVKNFRNRLTAAGLRLWNGSLGRRGVLVEEHPWLPRDLPYTLYFGVALLPMTVCLAASLLGGVGTAMDFEFGAITEYRLAPLSPALILAARLVRLALTALVSAGILLAAIGLSTGAWPQASPQLAALPLVAAILLPVAVTAGCLGIIAGLILRRTIPTFVVGLTASLGGWLLGDAFGLAAGFGGGYQAVSRLTPNAHAVELLFRPYYGVTVAAPASSALALTLFSGGMILLMVLAYRHAVIRPMYPLKKAGTNLLKPSP